MTISVSEVRDKLEAKLTSSVPLANRCRLAVNIVNSSIFIPDKEEIILNWILRTLDRKYNERIGAGVKDEEDQELWRTLAEVLTTVEKDENVMVDWSSVAETLTNVLPHSGLGDGSAVVSSCVTQLVTMMTRVSDQSYSEMWASVITALLSHSLQHVLRHQTMRNLIYQVLENLEIDTSHDYLEFIICLAHLYNVDQHSSVQNIVRRLLFHATDPYILLLSDLDCKYPPGHRVRLFLNTAPHQVAAPLIMAAAPQDPPWLRPKLFSFLVSCHGYPGILTRYAEKEEIESDFPIGKLFTKAFPTDLDFELQDGLTFGNYAQNVFKINITHCLSLESVAACSVLHDHCPQLLEPLIGLILEKRLSAPSDEYQPLFSNVLDVLSKMRRLPKMISMLFHHLQSCQGLVKLSWSSNDLKCLEAAIATLPKVQCLELWKSLNYLLGQTAGESDSSDHSVATALGPLMSCVLTSVHIVDHNTPSSLMARILDLIAATLSSLETLHLRMGEEIMRTLLYEVTSALHQLVQILGFYRNIDSVASVDEFALKVGKEAGSHAAGSYLSLYYKSHNKNLKNIKEFSFDQLQNELELCPQLVEDLSDKVLLKFIQHKSCKIEMFSESLRCSSALLYTLCTKLNKEEHLFIPEFEHWKKMEDLNSLDSYLGKSLGQALVSLVNSDQDFKIGDEEWTMLSSLPLENLPAVLKLAATLLAITCIYDESSRDETKFLTCSRCLKVKSDVFRFVDAGMFLIKVASVTTNTCLLEVVASTAGKTTKTMLDVDRSFSALEQVPTKQLLQMYQHLLKAMKECEDDSVKNEVSEKITKSVMKLFKGRSREDSESLELFYSLAAIILNTSAKKGLESKTEKFLVKIVGLCLQGDCLTSSSIALFDAVLNNIESLDCSSLPEGWRNIVFGNIISNCQDSSSRLLPSLIKTTNSEEFNVMMRTMAGQDAINLRLLKTLICSGDSNDISNRKESLGDVLKNVCSSVADMKTEDVEYLPELLTAVFINSQPVVHHKIEVMCLGCLHHLPLDLGDKALMCLASYISNHSTRSLSTIPITFSLIRHFISSSSVSKKMLEALQKVLWLVTRHKADYAPVLPHLLPDLLTFLQSLPLDQRGLLTTSLYKLLDMLDPCYLTYISSNLSPSTNELFKILLQNYESGHKFKGKA